MKYLTGSEWKAIVELMDDETRERVHSELASCTTREFLAWYLEISPEFWAVLEQEFGFDSVNDANLEGVPEITDYESLDAFGEAAKIAKRIADSDVWEPDDVWSLCRIARIEAAWENDDEPLEKVAEGAARILGVEVY